MLRAGNTEPSADPPIPASGSRTTCFRHRWGWQENIPDPGGSDRSPANAISQHKTLRPVSSRPTCIPSTCAGSRSKVSGTLISSGIRAGSSGISGIPRGERSCTPEGSCALGTSSHARRVVPTRAVSVSQAPIPMSVRPPALIPRHVATISLSPRAWPIMAHKPRSPASHHAPGRRRAALPFRLRYSLAATS